MTEMNTGQMIARREELKEILNTLPAIREEINLLNKLIALHDPLAEQVSVKSNGRHPISMHPGHKPCPANVEPAIWNRSETNRLLKGGQECKWCNLWFTPGGSIKMHSRVIHPGKVPSFKPGSES